MPKIINYNELNDESIATQLANPQLWGWNTATMHPVKEINGYRIIGDFNEPNHTLYGIFKNNSNQVLSAIDINIEPGSDYNIPLKNVAVVEMVATIEAERSKGFARLLYEYVIDKFKVLISNTKVFTSGNNISKTLGIWKNYIPTIATVFNYDTKTKSYSDLDINAGNDESIRFVAIKDNNIASKLTESFKDFVKRNAIKGAAALFLAATPSMAHNDEQKLDNIGITQYNQQTFKNYYNTEKSEQKNKIHEPSKILQPSVQQPTISHKIDINIISKIESNNKRKAVSSAGAKGICQLKKDAWNEAQKDLYGKLKYPYEKYVFNSKINKQLANHYYNEILPTHLDSFGLPITIDTLLASYNYGSNNVKKLMRRYGKNWKKYLPTETKNYLNSYKNLAEK
jgi:soluble lytic murein transglycosylase-like protein